MSEPTVRRYAKIAEWYVAAASAVRFVYRGRTLSLKQYEGILSADARKADDLRGTRDALERAGKLTPEMDRSLDDRMVWIEKGASADDTTTVTDAITRTAAAFRVSPATVRRIFHHLRHFGRSGLYREKVARYDQVGGDLTRL